MAAHPTWNAFSDNKGNQAVLLGCGGGQRQPAAGNVIRWKDSFPSFVSVSECQECSSKVSLSAQPWLTPP